MSKAEFLQKLRQALEGEVPPGVVQENLRYYDEYISGEAARGIPESEVTEQIGDPRLIAKTIIDAAMVQETTSSFRSSGGRSEEFEYRDSRESDGSFRSYHVGKWYWKWLIPLSLLLVIIVIIGVTGTLLRILMPILSPVLVILLVFWFIKSLKR